MNVASARHFVHPNAELCPVFIKALQDTIHKDGSISSIIITGMWSVQAGCCNYNILMKTCTLMPHMPVGGSWENAFFKSCSLHLQSIVVFLWKEFHCPGLLCNFGIEYLGSSEPFIALFMECR
jgi:hypothetical protein